MIRIAIGVRVRHYMYGEGVVIGYRGQSSDELEKQERKVEKAKIKKLSEKTRAHMKKVMVRSCESKRQHVSPYIVRFDSGQQHCTSDQFLRVLEKEKRK